MLPFGFSILLCDLFASVYCCLPFGFSCCVNFCSFGFSIQLCYLLAPVYSCVTFWLQYTVVTFRLQLLCYLLASVYCCVTFWLQLLCYLLASVYCCVTFWLQYTVVLPFGFSILLCYLLASVYYYYDTLEDALTQSSCLAFATPVQATDTDLHVYVPALAVEIWHTCA